MKLKLAVVWSLLAVAILFAQESAENHFLNIGNISLDGYISLNGKYTTVNNDNAGILELRFGIDVGKDWIVGLSFSGLSYDKKLSALVNDGTYHQEAGYAGLFVEKIFSITKGLKLFTSINFANGLTKYRYDKDFRKDKVWYQETIDETTFFVTEPSIGLAYNITGNWWIEADCSIKSTSPVQMIGTSEKVFNKAAYGIGIKYGVF